MNKNCLVTGANGFIGSYLCNQLKLNQFLVKGMIREHIESSYSDDMYAVGNIDGTTDWSMFIEGINVVIHTAARAHIMHDASNEPLNDYREVNTQGTLNLARQAVEAGVKRFIFISSIKVNGESTEADKPFKASDSRSPSDYYGCSKSEAEVQLLELAQNTGLEVVIIRPVLVYGPGVKANFLSLIDFIYKGLPLPFGCITTNKRSLVSIRNLVDLIQICIVHPKAVNKIFLVSDDDDISTSMMIKKLSAAMDRKNRMFSVPLWCFSLAGKLTGKQDVVNRLLGSLSVDISYTKKTLGWTPPQTLADGFRETVESWLKNKSLNK